MKTTKAMAWGMTAVLLLGACGKADTTTDDPVVDVVTEAQALSDQGGQSTSAAQAKGITELFVQEDPTLDVTQTAQQNAANVEAQVKTTVQTACPGATITLDSATATVTVNFGSACTLPNLGTVSGTVTATVTQPVTHSIQVAFTFTSLTVNGRSLTGTFTAKTANDSTFTVDASLTSGSKSLTLTAATLTLDADHKGLKIDGSGTVNTGTGPQAVSFAGVHHAFSGCYADAGSMTLSKSTTTKLGKAATVTETITFSSSTPTTGQVTVQVGTAAATTTTLPSYGHCGAADAGA
jgi:hypothetical protein